MNGFALQSKLESIEVVVVFVFSIQCLFFPVTSSLISSFLFLYFLFFKRKEFDIFHIFDLTCMFVRIIEFENHFSGD